MILDIIREYARNGDMVIRTKGDIRVTLAPLVSDSSIYIFTAWEGDYCFFEFGFDIDDDNYFRISRNGDYSPYHNRAGLSYTYNAYHNSFMDSGYLRLYQSDEMERYNKIIKLRQSDDT